MRLGKTGAILMFALLACAATSRPAAAQGQASVALTPVEQAWINAHPLVTLAVDQANPPLNFRRADTDTESFAGASIDYANLVAAKTGLKLRFSGSTWNEALQKAMAHQVDGVMGARERPERKLRLNFTTPYLELPIAMATRPDHPVARELRDFSGMRVAVVKNTVRIPVIQARCPACIVLEVDDPKEGMQRVARHEADGFFDDLPVVQRQISELGSPLKIGLLYYYSDAATVRFALRNDEEPLLSIFNKGLASITAEEHELIRTRWLSTATGISVQRDIPLSEQQRAWLRQHPVIRVGFDPWRAPVEWLGEDGKPRGISIEFLRRIEEMLGVRLQFVPAKNIGGLLEMAQRKEVDMVASIASRPDRQVYLGFSDAYLKTPVVIFTPISTPLSSGLAGLNGKRVALLGSGSVAGALRHDWPGITFIPVDNFRAAIEAMRKGRADAYAGPLMTGAHQLMEMTATDIRISGETDYQIEYAIGVRADWPELLAVVNQALAAIPKNERDAFRQKWSSINYAHAIDYRPLGALLLAVLVAVAFIVQLRRMVKRRTADLEREVATRSASEAELQDLRRHLQDLVVERTSELVSAKEEAVAANRAKSVFLSNMSHELRTPLNAILGFSALLRHDANMSPAQKSTLDLINRSGENLLSLINEVLDMSKIEAERLALKKVCFNLGAMLADVAGLMRQRAETKHLQLIVEHGADMPQYVWRDENKLRQMLINLLGNAIKFTDRGTVSMHVTTLAGALPELPDSLTLAIEVRDSGIGIALEDQARVFESFFQARSRSDQQGTGLGLAITSKLAELMGGRLTLSSEPGVGSCFRIELPVQTAEAEEAGWADVKRGRVTGLAAGQPAYRMLIVEDQLENWTLLQRLLEQAGFAVRVANNGLLGVEAFAEWRPHMVWVDVRMPVMDGIEATRRIRAQDGGAEVKIIAVTASAFRDERALIMAVGMDDFVSKPYREDEIFDCVALHLQVDFVRADVALAEALAKASALPALQAADFAPLPAELRSQLRAALMALDRGQLAAVVAEIETEWPELAAQIVSMTEAFKFREVCALID
ncbi:MAG: transporter substrate-binding domain-containing protein [Pseudomonadota bacterium]